jgi:hypothetical protein
MNEVQDRINRMRADPKIDIYKIVNGSQAFQLAYHMLFVRPEEWENPNEGNAWKTNWSDTEKDQSVLVIFGKTPISRTKVGFKLFISKGNELCIVGELRPQKKGINRWRDFLSLIL